MAHKNAPEIIRKELSHVTVEKIVIKYDPDFGEEIATVFVPTDQQFAAAHRKGGIHLQRAAKRADVGITVEVSNSRPKSKRFATPRKRHEGQRGRFILHRFCGDEEYAIKTAEIRAIREEKGISLWFEAETEGVCLKSLPDTAKLHAWPKAEVRVCLKALPKKLVGRRFKVTSAYDEKEEEYLATIYYVEHEDLRRNLVEIVSQEADEFLVRWTGITADVNYYDGSKPDTKVEIEGRFTFVDMEDWVAGKR